MATGPDAVSQNQACVRALYEAFARRDGVAMAACYADGATFCDPVFGELRGAEIGRMWQMLCASAKELRIEASDIAVDTTSGTAHWEAWYAFGREGRAVHNVIEARFTFHDGRIVSHVDSFGFWRWSRQALGPVGWFLGWTPLVRRKVQRDARRRLAGSSSR